ncbi:MAG: hexitol phosphatase HxpB [Thermoanaerobaculia bacterium]|nr:hexitol phosphatase HxpB [Thermoanaerobaculia bacterium]
MRTLGSSLPSVLGAIFDLDGLLIDSEPLWRQAEIATFAEVGIHLTEAQCEETMGLRSDAVIEFWYTRQPWQGPSRGEVQSKLTEAVRKLILRQGEPLPGALAAIEHVRGAGLAVAIASSSPPVLIDAAVTRLGLSDAFDAICSAADEEFGKPDPAVYLTAARRLGLDPKTCVAFEDSTPGIEAARRAGMFVVAVPAASDFGDPRFDLADYKLRSLTEFTLDGLTAPAS